MIAAMEFAAASAELYAEKQQCPADDVMSVWTKAEIQGAPLTLDEVIPDCPLVLDGGAETTRTVIARMILNLVDTPDQWALLRDGADMIVAVEEFIRFVTPIHNMCRVATRDVELGGERIREGEQVVLMYSSANRDPAHFTDPERLDVTRHPNQHLSFGFGTHVHSMRLVEGSVVEMPNAFVYGLKSARVPFEETSPAARRRQAL